MDPYEINLIVEVHVLGYGKFHLIDGDNSMSNRRVEFEPKGKISVSNMLKSKPKKKKKHERGNPDFPTSHNGKFTYGTEVWQRPVGWGTGSRRLKRWRWWGIWTEFWWTRKKPFFLAASLASLFSFFFFPLGYDSEFTAWDGLIYIKLPLTKSILILKKSCWWYHNNYTLDNRQGVLSEISYDILILL